MSDKRNLRKKFSILTIFFLSKTFFLLVYLVRGTEKEQCYRYFKTIDYETSVAMYQAYSRGHL